MEKQINIPTVGIQYLINKFTDNKNKNDVAIEVLNFILKLKYNSYFFETGLYSDITIKIDEKEYKLHKEYIVKSKLFELIIEITNNKTMKTEDSLNLNIDEKILTYI